MYTLQKVSHFSKLIFLMLYTRAIWIDIGEEYEGTVPSVWIINGKVYWPRGLNVKKSFQNLEKPSNHWHSYLLKKTKVSGKCVLFSFITMFVIYVISFF